MLFISEFDGKTYVIDPVDLLRPDEILPAVFKSAYDDILEYIQFKKEMLASASATILSKNSRKAKSLLKQAYAYQRMFEAFSE